MGTKSSQMDSMAEGLSKILGCEIKVLREKVPKGYLDYVEIRYWIQATKDGRSWKFRFQNSNEVKRNLAFISDLLQMGLIKEDTDELRP